MGDGPLLWPQPNWRVRPLSANRAQFYLATHPQAYRLIVGLYARKLLAAGWTDDTLAVRSVIELSMQQYNSKLFLPGGRPTMFAHTDGDWRRPGFTKIPAVQCAIFTSPSHCGDRPVFGFDFYDLSTEVAMAAIANDCKKLAKAPLA